MNEEKLTLVKDIPEFEMEYKEDKDKFNHKVFAKTLMQIIEDNTAPLVLGLLGPWGSGKSTILNLLIQNLNNKQNDYKYVYFNAWKYSNDSFRRQFLLECTKGLIADEKERKQRSEKIKQRFIRDFEKEVFSLKDLLKVELKPNISTIIAIIISFGIMVPFLIYGIMTNNIPLWISSIVMGIFTFILEKQMPKLFQVNIPMEIDPQLVLPEQFEEEFESLIKCCNKKMVFIIDDIDRCPPHMIMNILDSIKNFFVSTNKNSDNLEAYKRCYFLIAMDDKAVTSILQKERGENYKNEEVLKFFDTTLCLSPISHADLIQFSKVIAKDYSISEEAVQIAIYDTEALILQEK